MRLVTWNVNSLNARLPRVLQLLDDVRPDVVCLQETKTEPAAFPDAALRSAGYAAVHHSAGRWAGVAILAADEPREATVGLPGEAVATEARWVEASTSGLRVASVYVPNGRAVGTPTFAEKLRFLDAMRSRLAVGGIDVLVGDLNVTRADIDVYDPAAFVGSTHVTPEERSRLEALLDGGYVDAYRALHPDDVGYTWWDYRAGHFHKRLGLRIDYVLVSAAVAPRLRSATVLRDYRKGKPTPSDHAPVLCELAR